MIATALLASIGDGRQFKNGRELAAWIGLVPRQRSSGKIRLVGIGKRAHRYLRNLLIDGGRAVLRFARGKTAPRSRWLAGLGYPFSPTPQWDRAPRCNHRAGRRNHLPRRGAREDGDFRLLKRGQLAEKEGRYGWRHSRNAWRSSRA